MDQQWPDLDTMTVDEKLDEILGHMRGFAELVGAFMDQMGNNPMARMMGLGGIQVPNGSGLIRG